MRVDGILPPPPSAVWYIPQQRRTTQHSGRMMPDRDDGGRFLPAHTQPGPGRTSKYHDDMPEQARKLAMLGLTDPQIAQFFGIGLTTFYVWMHQHDAFSEGVGEGRTIADAEVAHSLYQRAVGMEVLEDRLARDRDGAWTTWQLRKQLPPHPGAAAMWLGARQKRLWSRKAQEGEQDGDLTTIDQDRNRVDQMDDETLDARIRELERRRAHDEGR